MSAPNYSARRKRLVRLFKGAAIDGLLVTSEASVQYLTGFTGDSTRLFVGKKEAILISDTRYTTQIARECGDLEVVIRDSSKTMQASTAAVLTAATGKNIGVEADHLSFAAYEGLSSEAENVSFVSTSGLVEKLRMVKDKWEIVQIREAVHCAQRGFEVVKANLTRDQTEQEIRYILEAAMRKFGANGPGFEPIVGVGPTAALPHAHAGQLQVKESPVLLIDWGAETKTRYRSDLTRVLITGKPTKEIRKVYNIVLEAQQRAIAAIRPGASCLEIDTLARAYIADSGYGDYFGHGLGHGFGLEIHESPRMSPLSDQILEPGMVITVEPGIYLPENFGVRIEDDILVTNDGHEVLTSVPREFDDAIIDYLA
ncbi:MAG: Xaa-Pro peptidase family protein [Fuerstiella sp.]